MWVKPTMSLTTLMNERHHRWWRGGVNVALAVQLAKEVMIDGKPAIEDSAVSTHCELLCRGGRAEVHQLSDVVSALSRRYSGA